MGRRSYYDEDEERLPEGMVRIGYDADSETYTFRDEDGSIWESAPGNRYGSLTKISNGTAPPRPTPHDGAAEDDGDDQQAPFLPPGQQAPPPYSAAPRDGEWGSASQPRPETSWRHELMPLLNFAVLIGLFLLGLFWFLGRSTRSSAVTCAETADGVPLDPYVIQSGDTCWALAHDRGLSLDELLHANKDIACERLKAGQTICIPTT